ncbi:hypothetical protein GS483_08975 [Rhodococcus hoagii]|nr:hypothetical protein [Prescottella equi]
MDILDVLNRGTRRVEELNETIRLRSAANAFLAAYGQFDGFGVVAASPQAERVLGAAMMLCPRLTGDGNGKTVILDVNIASGTLIAQAARRLRDHGNTHQLVGLVLNTLVDDRTTWDIPGLSDVVIVDHEFARDSVAGQPTECSHDSLALAV